MINLDTESFYSVLGAAPDASAKEIRACHRTIRGELERKRLLARHEEDRRDFEIRLERINAIGDHLASPERRAEYDADNAHLTYFLVRKAAAPMLEDRGLRLRWIHRTVREFLVSKGDPVAPATDLERTDFSSDFTPSQLLDHFLLNWRLR